jgi:Uma2 family endonuclease
MNHSTSAEAEPVVVPAPSLSANDELYEIIDGRRVELPPMSAYASRIAFEVARQVGNFGEAKDLGVAVTESLFHLTLPVDRNRRPDAAFVSYERWAKGRRMVRRDNAWDVVPELAVEVISPTDLAEDLFDKIDEYFRAGVRLVWVINPGLRLIFVYDSITSVHGLTQSDVLDGGTVLPGFRVPVAAFFPEAEDA